MLQRRIIPCLLLKNRGLVKTIKFANPSYVGDPINAVKIFNDKEVDELVFLDISASQENRGPNFDLLADIASECFMPLGYGGGIRTIQDVKKILRIGVEKVILNTVAVENPNFIREAADSCGSQSVVVSIDVKKTLFGKYEVRIKNGSEKTKLDPVLFAQEAARLGAGEILLNSIDLDGTMSGFDTELISKVSKAVAVPVVACGGAGSLKDFTKAFHSGAAAVAAGSFFVYHGPHRAVLITYPNPVELQKINFD
jgi:imidazole glycerol-phosphate synthase subunit HisF